MRSWLLMASVVLVAGVVAFASPSDGSAGMKLVTVAITAAGPSPSTVRIGPLGQVLFVNRDSVAHTVVVRQNAHAQWTCPLAPAGQSSGGDQCTYGGNEYVSRHAYTVDGQFPGKVVVVGLPRSVSLTARTHTVALGSPLTLHGQVTFENWLGNVCDRFPISILARHDRSQKFTRIAYLPARALQKGKPPTSNRCTYVWQRSFRPGVATTYIAKVRGFARVWRLATSRPYTVTIRP